jgi:protein-S-isoprenylcysteine O-methyltransferase Ste14
VANVRAGWLIVLLSTFLINHFELFGLQQAWFPHAEQTGGSAQLRHPFFYRWVAHPLYAGFFLAFWATPKMTARPSALRGRHVGLHPHRDPIRGAGSQGLFGKDYEDYRCERRMLTPRFGAARR